MSPLTPGALLAKREGGLQQCCTWSYTIPINPDPTLPSGLHLVQDWTSTNSQWAVRLNTWVHG